jgi:pimeloyl-ACP methyl ester carboxylesterase
LLARYPRVRRAVLVTLAVVVAAPVVVLGGFRIAAAMRERQPREAAAPPTGRFVRAGDLDVFVQETGPKEGEPVLLIHGTGAWSEIWRSTLDTLAASGYRAIAIDMPPFGFSDRPADASYTNEPQARRILGVIAALNLERVTMVAHSFGARPAMEAFFMDSSRFSRLVLIDAALGLDTGAAVGLPVRAMLSIPPLRDAIVSATATNPMMTARLLRGLISDTTAITEARLQMLRQPLVRRKSTANVGRWLRVFMTSRERTRATDRARYPSIGVPTLVIWGETDSVTPIAQGREIAGLIPGAAWVSLPNVGHIPAIEAPGTFNRALVAWLSTGRDNTVGR